MSGYPGYYPSNNGYQNNNNYPTYPGPASATEYPEKSSSRYQYDDRSRNYKQEKYDKYESRSVDRDDRGGRGRDRDHREPAGYGYPQGYPSGGSGYGGRGGALPLPPPPTGGRGAPVITSQPKSGGDFRGGQQRDWSSGLMSCTDDMKICMCVWCCSPFYQCCIMEEEFGEHCCNAWINPAAFLAIRYKMRHEENIEGSLLQDCMVGTFCQSCMMCQLLRENKHIKGSQFRNNRSLEARVDARATDAYMQRY